MSKSKSYYLGKLFYFIKRRLPKIFEFFNKNLIFSILINSWIKYYKNYIEIKEVKKSKKSKETINPIITKEL